jgi:hypothetical protein
MKASSPCTHKIGDDTFVFCLFLYNLSLIKMVSISQWSAQKDDISFPLPEPRRAWEKAIGTSLTGKSKEKRQEVDRLAGH